jgi:hypothetical protein
MQKRQFHPAFLGAAFSVLLLQGCAVFHHTKPSSPLAGSWTNQTGTVWTLNEDGTFDVDLTRDGQRDTHGKYTIKGDTITLRSTGGMIPKSCSGNGVYHFARNGSELSFTLVSDDCRLRRKNVLLVWHLKSGGA